MQVNPVGISTDLLGQLKAALSELVRKLPSDVGSEMEDSALKGS
jgi:hypothetical protein